MESYNETLRQYGIKPSYTRMMIYGYLKEKMSHPTADEIFQALIDQMPTLSKTTVYNTLHLFIEKEIASAILMNNQETRYDLITRPHAHFKCKACHAFFDVEIEPPHIDKKYLDQVEVHESQLLYIGLCSTCKNQSDTPQ